MAEIIGNRYQIISKIGAGGMGAVYKAFDRLTGEQIALKRVFTPAQNIVFNTRSTSVDSQVALSLEFQTLASLRHPNIISVLDYGFEGQQPYFTMTLIENTLNLRQTAQEVSHEEKIDLLVQVLRALEYLHQNGIIHRDLKPQNVLVTPAGQVKVLDFGLATDNAPAGEHAGTLAYMSPEIVMGQAASVASDLYAVGVMAYEIFANQHPFPTQSVPALMAQILEATPDFSVLDADIADIVMRLMAKDPEDHYRDAHSVIEALPRGSEHQTIRESFLQAAKFIGRRDELKRLIAALDDARNSTGSLWLIGGESGVGKSRLINELRTQALVRGVVVTRGQAVSEGGAPFQVWRDVLRWLCLRPDLNDLECSVLKMVVPDIETLVGHPVADAPEIEPRAARYRFFNVIEGVFQRQTQPLLILLEDLHWSELELLQRLAPMLSKLPVLVVGSYRDDEKPDIPNELPTAQSIKLAPLTSTEIRALSLSMLGSVNEELVGLLERETEGNAFFLVEVTRALAEEAGELRQIGQMALPERVFAEGIKTLIERRLARVPDEARDLLRLAAVIGRRLNETLLQVAAPDINLEQWLHQCSSVLSVSDGYWQFAHDKLRQGILEALPDAPQMQRRAAVAIETAFPDNPDYYAALVNHWSQAGDTAKEAHYAALAGHLAVRHSAYPDAIHYLERALALSDGKGLAHARILKSLADASIGLGNIERSVELSRQALKTLGIDMPAPGEKSTGYLIRYGLTHLRQRILPPAAPSFDDETIEFIGDLLVNGAIRYGTFLNELMTALSYVLYAMNVMESLGRPSPLLSASYGITAVGLQSAGIHRIGDFYIRLAQQTLEKVENPDPAQAASALLSICYYLTFSGAWEAANVSGERAREITRKIGFDRVWRENTANVGLLYYLQGRFDEGLMLGEELRESSNRGNDAQTRSWALAGITQMQLRLGQTEQALATARERDALLPDNLRQKTSPVAAYMALAHFRLHDLEAAASYLEPALEELRRVIRKPTPHDYYALFNILEVSLEMWHAQPDQGERFAKIASEIFPYVEYYAKRFRVGVPRLEMYRGLYQWLNGDQKTAFKHWAKAESSAKALKIPYDLACVQFWMAKAHHPDRSRLQAAACKGFTSLGAMWDMYRASEG